MLVEEKEVDNELSLPDEVTLTQDSEFTNPLEDYSDLVDNEGRSFDESLHLVGEDGAPLLTQRGKLRKKRQKRGASSINKTTLSEQVQSVVNDEHEQYKVVGSTCANGLIALGIMLGGEDFAPVRNNQTDEKALMESAFTEWCQSREIKDIPPNTALMITVGAYLLPRLTMPKQVSKFKMLKLWFKEKFTRKPKKGTTGAFDPNKGKK